MNGSKQNMEKHCAFSCRLYLLLVISVFLFASAKVQALVPFSYSQPVIVCEFDRAIDAIPSFVEPECTPKPLIKIDPQHKELWVAIDFDRSDAITKLSKPLAFFSVWQNGQ